MFGGTFDPPHLGHLAIAERAREELGLEHVIFIPSGMPPHKEGERVSPASLRLAMTRLAVKGNPGFRVSDLEARRGGRSYTVDTLRALRASRPDDELHLLIGEDSLAEFHTWHEPRVISTLAKLVVVPRPGHAARPARLSLGPGRVLRIEGPCLEISSSTIRDRLRAGRSVRYLVPDEVLAFVLHRGLYGEPR